jgi:hypothetical protein
MEGTALLTEKSPGGGPNAQECRGSVFTSLGQTQPGSGSDFGFLASSPSGPGAVAGEENLLSLLNARHHLTDPTLLGTLGAA